MSIQSLGNNPLSVIFSYLDVKERTRCLQVCRRFRNIIESPESNTLLWSSKTIKAISPAYYRFPSIQLVFQRHFANFSPHGESLPDAHTGYALALFSYCNLVLSCDLVTRAAGEVKIWQMESGLKRCTFTLPPLVKRVGFIQLRVSFAQQGNWLIRSTYEVDGQPDALFHLVDVWELDKRVGIAKKIFVAKTLLDPHEFHRLAELVNPVRHENRLFIPIPCTNEVHVWSLSDLPEKVKTLPAILARRCTVASLELNDETLRIGYDDGQPQTVNVTDFSCKASFSAELPRMPHLVHNNCGWAVTKELPGRFSLYKYDRVAKGEFVNPHYIPYPLGFNPEERPFRTSLGWHHFVIGDKNKCFVYKLWSLNNDGSANYIYELPNDSVVVATHLHRGKLVAATIDGKIWIFDVPLMNGADGSES